MRPVRSNATRGRKRYRLPGVIYCLFLFRRDYGNGAFVTCVTLLSRVFDVGGQLSSFLFPLFCVGSRGGDVRKIVSQGVVMFLRGGCVGVM